MSFSFWATDALYRLNLTKSWTNYNTGRMYCITPVQILVDSSTDYMNAWEVDLYFSWWTEISPISNWNIDSIFYAWFVMFGWLPVSLSVHITWSNDILRLAAYTNNPANYFLGNWWLFWTFRFVSLTWITSTTFTFKTWWNPASSISWTWWSIYNIWWQSWLTIYFATWPCLRDYQWPIINIESISNGAYRVTTWNNLNFLFNDWADVGKWYKYATTNYSDVSISNYFPDITTTWDNQYGVNSGSLNVKIWLTIFNWSNFSTKNATWMVWDLRDRWYDVTINSGALPAFGIEQEITLTATWEDNLWNLSISGITFNSPRAPFVYRTWIANWNGGIWSINSPYINAKPNRLTNVYPRLNTIRFVVLDDRAWVDSSSLSVTIRSWWINGEILYSTWYNWLILSWLTYMYDSNGLGWSSGITHSYNYDIIVQVWWTSGFDLPYNTNIYVVISWYDLASNHFVTTWYASDQKNYFSFTTRNSCPLIQCIDRVIIDTWDVSTRMVYSWSVLFVTWWTNPYVSGDILYCNMAQLSWIDLQTWYVTFYTWYTWMNLVIKPTDLSWFTTYLSWDTVYVLKYICGDNVIQDPNFSWNTEICDDGNNNDNDGCSSTCTLIEPVNCNQFDLRVSTWIAYSWDNIIFSGWFKTWYIYQILDFDDWYTRNVSWTTFNTWHIYNNWWLYTWNVLIRNIYGNGSVTWSCEFSGVRVNYCWDWSTNGSEQCDDSNNTNGDGCSSICNLETPSCADFTGDLLVHVNPTSIYSWWTIYFSGEQKTWFVYSWLDFDDGNISSINSTTFNTLHSYVWWSFVPKITIKNNYNSAYSILCDLNTITVNYCWDATINWSEDCDSQLGCNLLCTWETPTCTLQGSPSNGNIPLSVVFTWTTGTNWIDYTWLILGNGFVYSNFTGTYNYIYTWVGNFTATLYVYNIWSWTITGSCSVVITTDQALYTIQTWPEKRAQAWVNWTITYPNLRTRAKIWIYSWHVLLYTWEIDMWWWGTWEIQMNGILSWTYDITFEWLNNPRVMLSGIVLANTDRLIDFTTWDNTLWEYLNDVNLSAWYPYTWNYMYVWDLTWTSLNKTQRINSDDMWVLVWEYTKWLSYSNFGLDPYDLNADWTIDAWDFAMMVVNWNNAIQTITDNDYPWIQF